MKAAESLAGHFLLAMPQIGDPRFERSVIFILSHDAQGAIGFVINDRSEDTVLGDIAQNLPPDVAQSGLAKLPIFIGGPVDQDKGFILHSNDWRAKDTLAPEALGVSVTQSMDLLIDAAKTKGPRSLRILIGYAGWGAGQLENELQENAWLVAPGDTQLLFDYHNTQIYEQVARGIGVDLTFLSGSGGVA